MVKDVSIGVSNVFVIASHNATGDTIGAVEDGFGSGENASGVNLLIGEKGGVVGVVGVRREDDWHFDGVERSLVLMDLYIPKIFIFF